MNRDWDPEWGAVGALAHAVLRGARVVVAGAERGVFASNDSGAHWHGLSDGDGPRAVTSLACRADAVMYAGSATGIWRLDANRSWRRLLDSYAHAVAVVGAGPEGDWLVAGTELDGAVRSEDSGRTWTSATAGLLESTVLCLSSSPFSAPEHVVLAGTPSGMYFSRNDGKAWRFTAFTGERDDLAVQCLAVSPDWISAPVAFAGTENVGLLRTTDAGRSWERIAHFGERSINAIVCPAPARTIVAAGREIVLSIDSGRGWQTVAEASNEVWSLLVPESGGGNAVLAGMAEGGVARFELDR